MKTEKLYEFLILSKTLNYSKAARNLYITQSVLSKHIQEMEEELNTRLFYRTTHGVSLTEAGTILAQKAEALIDRCDSAVNLIQMKNFQAKGNVNVLCATELAYSSHIRLFISHFMERYPDIHTNFEVQTEGTPEELVHDSHYDFIFTPCEYLNLTSNVHPHLLHQHGTYVALPVGHHLISKPQVYLRELEGETLIVPFAGEFFGPYAKNWMLAQKYTHDKVNCIKVPNLLTGLFLVSIGKGIAIIPRYARNLVNNNIFLSRIANELCCFNEYMYYRETPENGAAKLFYEEFRRIYPALFSS